MWDGGVRFSKNHHYKSLGPDRAPFAFVPTSILASSVPSNNFLQTQTISNHLKPPSASPISPRAAVGADRDVFLDLASRAECEWQVWNWKAKRPILLLLQLSTIRNICYVHKFPKYFPQLGERILIRPNTMWRAFFCAIGIVLIIMGIECLLIDSAVLVAGVFDEPIPQIQQQSGGLFAPPVQVGSDHVFRPSEWFPWSLLASGAIVLLYSVSLRRTGTQL
jgi:hypothetical protein